MSGRERADEAFELLCITTEGGALGFTASEVAAIREAGAAIPGDVPAIDLAPFLGPGAPGAISRRIRVAAAEAPPFDLVTDGALSVRSVTRRALHPLPRWLAPFCAPLGVEALLLDEGALVLVVDARRLGARCAPPDPAAAPAVARPHE